MGSSSFPRTLALLLLFSLLPLALILGGAAQDPAMAAGGARLAYSVDGGFPHGSYVAGQAMTLTGNVGMGGQRRVWVESNMHRPGDRWTRAEGFGGTTDASGNFRLHFLAPGMFNIGYRVVGQGGHPTPQIIFKAQSQEILLIPDSTPRAGQAFSLTADTTPEVYRHPDLIGTPIFEGRTLTLQRRTSATGWETLSTTQVGSSGLGRFSVTQPEGTTVYRVRAEDWTRNGSDVGWVASYPTALTTGVGLDTSGADPGSAAPSTSSGGSSGPTREAEQAYHWYPLLWDFAWERGQDLDSTPNRGSDPDAHWLQYSSGTGRASKHNGGLAIDTGLPSRDGSLDRGTTRGVLQNAPMAYGRWEARLRLKENESRGRPFHAVMDLVPARGGAAAACQHRITVASFTGAKSGMSFGVVSNGHYWHRSLATPNIATAIPALAVEVGKSHITWFLNGQAIGSVRSPSAMPKVPLTLRIGLVGSGSSDGRNTSLYSDWQRGFPLSTGKQVTSGPRLSLSAAPSCGQPAKVGAPRVNADLGSTLVVALRAQAALVQY